MLSTCARRGLCSSFAAQTQSFSCHGRSTGTTFVAHTPHRPIVNNGTASGRMRATCSPPPIVQPPRGSFSFGPAPLPVARHMLCDRP